MKKSMGTAQIRNIDSALTIYDLFNGRGFAFDCVVADLNGHHPLVVNKVSDRIYYVLDGGGVVTVGPTKYDVKSGDLIAIKAATPHGLDGTLRYLIVTAPPFNPENESLHAPQ